MDEQERVPEQAADQSTDEPEVSGHLFRSASELADIDPIDEAIDGADPSSGGTARPGVK